MRDNLSPKNKTILYGFFIGNHVPLSMVTRGMRPEDHSVDETLRDAQLF